LFNQSKRKFTYSGGIEMKNETITIRISEAEKQALKAIAANKDIPMSQLIREAVKKLIQEESK
jgi:predicted DNA binding CopG/RHH family protein